MIKNTKLLHLKKQRKEETFENWRFVLIYCSIVLALLSLVLRMTWLQIINKDKLVKESNLRSLRIKIIPSTRGTIKDRVGHLLAINIPTIEIWIDPKKIYQSKNLISSDKWKTLSKILSISLNKFTKYLHDNQKKHFLYLAHHIHPFIAEKIQKLNLPGIYLQQTLRRYYPKGKRASQLIGITDINGEGIEGIEKSFENLLNGKTGKRIIRKDRLGRVVENINFIKEHTGHNLELSIDMSLQELAYRELKSSVFLNKAKSGSVVLVDIKTGEVLAMVNNPSYDPNDLKHTLQKNIRNRAISDMFEPGSTVKPMVLIAALKENLVNKNSILNTTPYQINGHEIKDVANYKKLNLTGILQKSSNVGVSRLALSMKPTVLLDTYSRFGLGKRTNLGIIGESNGYYPKRKHWSNIERATFSFGYGLMVTPLQLAKVYTIIGNYGIDHPLSIIKINTPVTSKRVFQKSFVKSVAHMMESVALPGGGGIKAAIKGYRIAIKTGTVKKVDPTGHYFNKYIAYTTGIAPADSPRFALVALINEPKAGKYYGGSVSAPLFKNIMSEVLHIMHIKPDMQLLAEKKDSSL